MAATKKTVSLSELATSVLEEIRQGQAEKVAADQLAAKKLSTEIGQAVQKLASDVRNVASGDITYADLDSFRKTYNV